MIRLSPLLAALAAVSPLAATISLTSFDTPYFQDFDFLGPVGLINENSTGEFHVWVQGETVPGWYADLSDGLGNSININTTNPDTGETEGFRFVWGNGAASVARVPSIRNWGKFSTQSNYLGDPSDRALGLLVGSSSSAQSAAIAVAFKNDSTDRAINGVAVSFAVEAWRRHTGGLSLQAAYAVVDEVDPLTFRLADGWTPIPELNFNVVAGSTTGLDGNAVTFQVSATIGIEPKVQPGKILVLRWYQPAVNSGSGFGFDNFLVSFQTEEATDPGTDPEPGELVAPVISLSPEAEGLVIRWQQPAGTYTGYLESAPAVAGPWETIATFPTAEASEVSHTDATWSEADQRFYRVRVE